MVTTDIDRQPAVPELTVTPLFLLCVQLDTQLMHGMELFQKTFNVRVCYHAISNDYMSSHDG